MEDEHYADFIKYYRDNTENEESYKAYWMLNRDYAAEDTRLASQHGIPVQSRDLTRDNTGKSKTHDATSARHINREDYKEKADKIARQHGFKGKSYDEHKKEQQAHKGKTQEGKPDDKEPPPNSTAGSAKTVPKTPSKEEQRQAFMKQLREAGSGLTKGKERER